VLEASDRILGPQQYAPFLTNHDQNRVVTELDGNREKTKVAASLLLTFPGMPLIYYGEEIGMEGMKPDENILRLMLWNAGQNAGFTAGKPWRQIDSKYKLINVDIESSDSGSLFSHYRLLLQIRNSHPALRSGDFSIIKSNNATIFSGLRNNRIESILALVNSSGEPMSN
jgi:alpha-amylase